MTDDIVDIMGGARIKSLGLSVSGVRVKEQLAELPPKRRRQARAGTYLNGEWIVTKDAARLGISGDKVPAWGWQINCPGYTAACGPYLTRFGAICAAKKAIRERMSQ